MKRKTTTPNSARWDVTRWVLLGVLLIGLILLVAVFSDGSDSDAYQRGHEALIALDCTAAVPEFDTVLNTSRLVDVRGFAYRAGREKEQCLLYQQALEQESAGHPGDAASSLYALMRKYETSPLYPLAKENLTGIVNGYDLETLATDPFCQDFEGVVSGAGLSETSTQQIYPRIVDACGKMYEASGNYQAALDWYDAFLEGHIAHDWSDYFRQALARTMLAEISQRGAAGLPSPVWVGDGTGSTFVLDFYIQAPKTARIILAGPSTRIINVKGCPDCEVIPNTGGPGCQHSGKPVRVELPVGTYQVLIETGADADARAYQAAWAMDTGEYEVCMALE